MPMQRPDPKLTAQKQRQLFEAITAEFPLTALGWGEDLEITFIDGTAEKLNQLFLEQEEEDKEPEENKALKERQQALKMQERSDSLGLTLISRAKPAEALEITNQLEDLIDSTLGFLIDSLSDEWKPNYRIFIKEITGGRGFNIYSGRLAEKSGGSLTYLSLLANSGKLYRVLDDIGAFQADSAATPGFVFLTKIIKSDIPRLAKELLNLVQRAENSISIHDEILFKKLWNGFNSTPDSPAQKIVNFSRSLETLGHLKEVLPEESGQVESISSILQVMITTAYVFIEIPRTYTAQSPPAADYSSFRADCPEGFATRCKIDESLETPKSLKSFVSQDMVGFALYAAQGLKRVLEEDFPIIRSRLADKKKIIDDLTLDNIENDIRDMLNLIEKSGIMEDFQRYKYASGRDKHR
jgi:hypothetical protein